MTNSRWRANAYILNRSVVGSISQGASKDWYAFGCMSEWEDSPLGCFANKEEARRAVEDWVREKVEEADA